MANETPDVDRNPRPSEAVSSADFNALLERVVRLEDERAIIDVLHRYGQAADDGEDRVWAELFTEDGVFRCTDRAGQTILREQGRENLARWLRDFRANEKLLTKHVVIAPVIALEGDRAVVKSYLTRLSENPNPAAPPFLLLMGRYHDELVRCADGRWRFQSRIAQAQAPQRADLSE